LGFERSNSERLGPDKFKHTITRPQREQASAQQNKNGKIKNILQQKL